MSRFLVGSFYISLRRIPSVHVYNLHLPGVRLHTVSSIAVVAAIDSGAAGIEWLFVRGLESTQHLLAAEPFVGRNEVPAEDAEDRDSTKDDGGLYRL